MLSLVMAVALAMVCPGAATAQTTIEPGTDLFQVIEGPNSFVILNLPADFFGPGSDPEPVYSLSLEPFDLNLNYGELITWVMNRIIPVPIAFGDPATVPFEIVALELQSVDPITVTYNGGESPELWDLFLHLDTSAGTPPSTGQWAIQHDLPGGGHITDSTAALAFDLEFVSPSGYIVVDATNGSESIDFGNPTDNPTFSFTGSGDVVITPDSSNFWPGIDPGNPSAEPQTIILTGDVLHLEIKIGTVVPNPVPALGPTGVAVLVGSLFALGMVGMAAAPRRRMGCDPSAELDQLNRRSNRRLPAPSGSNTGARHF